MKTPENYSRESNERCFNRCCSSEDNACPDDYCEESAKVIRAAMQAAIDAALLACENERAPDTGDDADIAHNHACDDCAEAIRAIKI